MTLSGLTIHPVNFRVDGYEENFNSNTNRSYFVCFLQQILQAHGYTLDKQT